MSGSRLVFRCQFARFKRDKGAVGFYCAAVAIFGILVPGSSRLPVTMHLISAALYTVVLLSPILINSMADERERKTLETLLSAPIDGKTIVLGKFLFSLAFALCFFGITALCAALTYRFTGNEAAPEAWQWLCVMLMSVFCFSAVSIAGVLASAASSDKPTASVRVSIMEYPLGLLFAVYIGTVIISGALLPALIAGVILLLIYLCVILACAAKASSMKQYDFFENLKSRKAGKARKISVSLAAPKSQFWAVLGFELKCLLARKSLLIFFGILCFAPVFLACILPYIVMGEINLNPAVLAISLLIYMDPPALILYSIRGEKDNKTAESLLSTPLGVRPIFLAKCALPVLFGAAMLAVSSLLVLLGAGVISRLMPEMAVARGFSIPQLVLLFPVGIMASMLLVFISAALSVMQKSATNGMLISYIFSLAFYMPIAFILSNSVDSKLMWSLIYLAVLLIFNALCIVKISGNISRPQIMKRL